MKTKMKYTFKCERYDEYKKTDNENFIIEVIATTEKEAYENISNYNVCYAELHYCWIINVEPYNGSKLINELKDYRRKNNGLGLLIAGIAANIRNVQMCKPERIDYSKIYKDEELQYILRQ